MSYLKKLLRSDPISRIRTYLPDTVTVGRARSGYRSPFSPMEPLSTARIAAALLLALPLAACGPSDEADRAQSGPIVGPFVVSSYFTPSGLMGDGAVPGRLTVDINVSDPNPNDEKEHCKTPRPPGAQGDCYTFVYRIGDVRWAGAYWVHPANNWGTAPGRNVIGPVDMGVTNPDRPGSSNLRGYTRVRFSMAIEQNTRERGVPMPNAPLVQYWAGRLDGRKATPPQPYYDVGCSVFPDTPPFCTDTSGALPVPNAFAPVEESGKPTVDWQQFTIDLSRWSVESVIGAFGFATNDNDNPGIDQRIYFDDIVWE